MRWRQPRPAVGVRPFADCSPKAEHVQPFELHGSQVLIVPAGSDVPELAWLASLRVDLDDGAELEQIRFLEINGCMISGVSGEALHKLMDDTIPFEFDATGLGCLANLSSAVPYCVELIGKGTGRLIYTGRELAAPATPYGLPQRVSPPLLGLTQMWSQGYMIAEDATISQVDGFPGLINDFMRAPIIRCRRRHRIIGAR